jgi:hypothetical protein
LRWLVMAQGSGASLADRTGEIAGLLPDQRAAADAAAKGEGASSGKVARSIRDVKSSFENTLRK